MDTFEADSVVIGAGVVGLACAAALAKAGHDVVVLEEASLIGSGTSSRNSEVIHAGVYYPEGSLKAQLCVEGRDRLYAYCRTRHIPHSQCGKLIVATNDAEADKLAAIAPRAIANGAGLQLVDGAHARKLEPGLSAVTAAALDSPLTGIVDSHALMVSLQGELEDHGGQVAFETVVTNGGPARGGLEIVTAGAMPARLLARQVVNAAGLHAPAIARALQTPPAHLPQVAAFAKGNYFKYSGRHPFSRLIYPTPVDGGLGVHLTFDLAGEARFGPDVEWLDGTNPDAFDYDVDPARGAQFAEKVQAYWPGMDPGRLTADYAGIRPKLSGPGMPAADFRIDGPGAHGFGGLVNLFGIESPGLTASLAIAERVVGQLQEGTARRAA